ncbi:unnamed protein product [Paramecium sonneborni]|uniref:Protein kinase domain-containing protein n=1 Tax=Paramecium sonneborni TaxID=65129 RepID=A0A8S1P0X7_9CILI|nr:unnamed protein product [Paramecium sonneborni]
MQNNQTSKFDNENIIINCVTYIKLEKLGEGTESNVYKGLNTQTNEIVAIKEYKQQINEKEYSALQALQKQNLKYIIGIKEVLYQEQKETIIIMEFADGEFNEFMKTDDYKQLSIDQKNKYFIQMAKGVNQLHGLGLFHRDLKPVNFVYFNKPNNQKIIKLIDFGKARNIDNNNDELRKTYQVGTPQYGAPEIITGDYDNQIDIWSLGLVWWEMLTNEPFFKSINQKKKYNQQMIDSEIDSCKFIQEKESNFLKKMLNLEASKRLQLKEIIYAYKKQDGKQQNLININQNQSTYRIINKIGQGAECIVYKGQNTQTNEIVAIKEYKQINQNELKAIQAINQKNYSHIIGIKAVQQNSNSCIKIVMEFADGDFYKFMSTQDYQRLGYDQKNQYFLQIAKGVDQLHDLGFFHRDLKPENFALIDLPNNQKIIKLINFGFVKETGNFMAKTACVGTPYYIAPEVLKYFQNQCYYDKQVDIWSLGAIWYEMLTGQKLFNGNNQDEIFNQILNSSQKQIDQLIQNNQYIQIKEKELIKRMLRKTPIERKSLKEIIAAYIQQQVQYQPFQNQQFLNQQPQIQQNQNLYQNQFQQFQFQQQQQQKLQFNQMNPQIQPTNNIQFPSNSTQIRFKQQIQQETKQKNMEEELKQKREDLEKQKEKEFAEKLEIAKQQLQQDYEKEIRLKENELKQQQEKAQQQDEMIQQAIKFQNEMNNFKQQKEEEYQKNIEQIQKEAQKGMQKEIDQQLQDYKKQIKEQLEIEIEEKYKQDQINKENELKQKQEQENKKQLEEKKQSLIIQLQTQSNNIQMFISNLNQKLVHINDIDTQVQNKNELINLINNEIQKQNKKQNENEESQQQIQKASLLQELSGLDNKISQEMSQNIEEQNKVINKIREQQIQLEKDVSEREKNIFQLQFTKVQEQFNLFQGIIQKFQEKIKFYDKVSFQMQEEEKLHEVIGQYEKLLIQFQVLQSLVKNINQFELSQQVINYQTFNIKVEEIQQSQNRLKNQIDESNKSIEQTDIKFINEHRRQLDVLAHNLNDYLDKFKYLSKNEKYKNKIDQIISKIENCFNQLNQLNQLLTQGIFQNYQQFNQKIDSINQNLYEFQKQHNQLHEQIYQDQQIQQQNDERTKKLKNIEGQLKEFTDKMNSLKTQINNLINNQYCNNEYTRNLIMEKQSKIDQNINQIQNQFKNFKDFNQLTQSEINNQISSLEQFQEKLKKQIDDEQEQVIQLQFIIQKIGAENKSEQEKELLQQTNKLQQKQMQLSKALSTEKKEGLLVQLKEEIKKLEEYNEINNENQKLFNEKLQQYRKQQTSPNQQNKIQELLQKQQKFNFEKTLKLKYILGKVRNKPNELQFEDINNNPFDQFDVLKENEKKLSQEINSIISQELNQQLNPSYYDKLTKKINNLISEIDTLIQQIPQQNQIQRFQNQYKKNVEQFQILYALVNYIMQYHLTRYFERIKENEDKSKDKQQNFKEGSYIKAFHDKQNEQTKESTKKEKEAQDLLKIYENILFNNYSKKLIDEMERDYQTIKKEIETQENFIKQKNLVKLRACIKDQKIIKEIINDKQYYKITEFAQMLIFQIIMK